MTSGAISDRERGDTAAGVLRGTRRLLRACGCVSITEAPLKTGRRVDILAVDEKSGEILIVEIKSCRGDYLSDDKWREYLPWCDRFLFAIPPEMDPSPLPPDEGLIVADPWGGEFVRSARTRPLAPARRRAMLLLFARLAAARLHAVQDPQAASGIMP